MFERNVSSYYVSLPLDYYKPSLLTRLLVKQSFYRKYGGIRFLKFGSLRVTVCVAKKGA